MIFQTKKKKKQRHIYLKKFEVISLYLTKKLHQIILIILICSKFLKRRKKVKKKEKNGPSALVGRFYVILNKKIMIDSQSAEFVSILTTDYAHLSIIDIWAPD